MTDDREHLQLLSIFHYIVAALIGLFSLIPVIHLVLGIGMLSGSLANRDLDSTGIFVGWFFVLFSSAWIVIGLSTAACVALAGRFLGQQKHYRFCFVIACVTCVFMPFGTVLGVFTILVLSRASVKELFGEGATPVEVEVEG